MSKFNLFTFLALALIQLGRASDQPGGIGVTPLNGDRGQGYTIVDNGSITHCGTNTGQQCFEVNPLENVSITIPENPPVESSGTFSGGSNFEPVSISCQPDGRCATAFDFDQPGNYAEFLVNCLNYAGQDQGVNVHVLLGRGSAASSTADAYSYFFATGLGVQAKWENDADYTSNVSLKRCTCDGEHGIDSFLILFSECCTQTVFQKGRNTLHSMSQTNLSLDILSFIFVLPPLLIQRIPNMMNFSK